MTDDNQRKNDVIISRLEQKLDDFIEESQKWQERHDNTSKEWRIGIEKQLKELERFNSKIDTPVKVVLWAILIVFTAIFTAFGTKIFRWLDR